MALKNSLHFLIQNIISYSFVLRNMTQTCVWTVFQEYIYIFSYSVCPSSLAAAAGCRCRYSARARLLRWPAAAVTPASAAGTAESAAPLLKGYRSAMGGARKEGTPIWSVADCRFFCGRAGGKHAIGLSRCEGRGPVLQGSLIGDGSTETRVGGGLTTGLPVAFWERAQTAASARRKG